MMTYLQRCEWMGEMVAMGFPYYQLYIPNALWQSIRIYHRVRADRKVQRQGSLFGILILAKWWQTLNPIHSIFYLQFTQWWIFVFLTFQFLIYILKCAKKSLNMLRCNTTWWHHFDITMKTSDKNMYTRHVTPKMRKQGWDKNSKT